MSPEMNAGLGCPDPTADATPEAPGRFYGKYRGEVLSNLDPEKRGRILAVVPAVPGTHLNYALPCVPYAGDGVGEYRIPPKGAHVWIEYEGGNPNFPIWSGCWWNTGEFVAPAEIDPADTPLVKILKTKFNTFVMDDTPTEVGIKLQTEEAAVDVTPPISMTFSTSGVEILCGIAKIVMTPEEGITLTVAENTSIAMTEESITLKSGMVVIDAEEDVTITAGGKVGVEAGGDVGVKAVGVINMEAGGDATLDAGAAVEISAVADASMEAGGGIEISAGGEASIEAVGETNIASGANMSLESGIAVEVSAGADVSIEATGSCNMSAVGNIDITGIAQTINGVVEVDGDLLIDGQQPLVI